MDKKNLRSIVTKVELQNKFFKKKSLLDTMSYSEEIIGREKQTEELVTYLLGYKQGFVVPLISIYGRSGSGKSTITRFVCENIEITNCFVNLRQAKTVFGCMNLILGELGQPSLKSAQGVNLAIEKIEDAVISKLSRENGNFLVMVLDEFDVLFYDKRGKPSDFIYKMLVLEEHLKAKGLMMCLICISNNALVEYELDDRIRSRIGSSEIFFEPYSKDDVIKILSKRTENALKGKIGKSVLEYCAEISSAGHGDARRAIDLLRVAAENASQNREKITISHIDKASEDLQNDRAAKVISTATFHFKLVCMALARLEYLTEEDWHGTSTIFSQYCKILPKDVKPLSYRRVSEILTELENTGLVISQTSSKGRRGYGTIYKSIMLPAMLGSIVDKNYWKIVMENKTRHDEFVKSDAYKHPGSDPKYQWEKIEHDKNWKQFVGL